MPISRDKLLELCGQTVAIQGSDPMARARVIDVGNKYLIVNRTDDITVFAITISGIRRIVWKTEHHHELVA